MEKRIKFDEKIRVFISSRCGEKKYDDVRRQLKSLIENTGFAITYLFEERRASTLTAEQDYLYGLDNSDVCLFLIDNADGVPEGVLKEHQRAKAHPKKSLYIFCDEKQKEPTHIQKEITGAKGAKYYIADSFEEFVNKGYESLINDIGEIYSSYCKGRLIDPEFSISMGRIEEIDAVASESLDKQIFKNSDSTKKTIANIIFSRSDHRVEKTGDFDMYSSEFLNVLFGEKTIKEYNPLFLLLELKKMQSERLHKVVIERWNAIQHYYMNDLVKAREYEESALKIAKDSDVPNWLIQDILIDLKNLYTFEGQEKNQYILSSIAQKQLDSEKSALFYPLLDRYEKSLYEELTFQFEKSSMRSPYTVTYGNSIDKYVNYISNIYIMSVFNGSLTHLLRIKDNLKDIAFHMCHQYSDWEFRVLLLKMAMTKGNRKEIRDVIKLFNDVYGKMNGVDAQKIYEFVKSNPIKYQRSIAQFLAFQHLGYYFNDDFYSKVWNEVFEIIHDWITSDNRIVSLGEYLFDSIIENLQRLDNNLVIETIIKVFEHKLLRFYDKALEVIATIDFPSINNKNKTIVVDQLIELLKIKNFVEDNPYLGNAIISMRKQTTEFSLILDEAVMSFMPKSYKELYSLEINHESKSEREKHILRFITMINERNKTQGNNGMYIGYGDNPYKDIKSIILNDSICVKEELRESILQTCKGTLYAENQTLDAKVEAINLISFVGLALMDTEFDPEDVVNQLIDDEEIVCSGSNNMFFDKTTKETLYFNFLMMKLVFNKIKVEEVLESLSSYTELETYEKIVALKTIITILENKKSEKFDEKVLLLILQFTLESTNDSNHDVRFFATKALLYSINEDNKSPIMKKLLKLMDYDSVFIKILILGFSEELKALDEDSYGFIKEKALVDNHFVIRQKATII